MNPSAVANPESQCEKSIPTPEKFLNKKLQLITKTIPFNPKSSSDKKPEYYDLKVVDNEIVLKVDNALKAHVNDHVIPEQIRQINREVLLKGGTYQLSIKASTSDTIKKTTTYIISIEQRQEQYQNLVEEAIEQ